MLSKLINCHEAYNNDSYGIASNILSYLARPFTPVKTFNYPLALDAFLKRLPIENTQNHQFGFAPQDRNIFATRLKFISNNNRAYELATKENPSVSEVEEFAGLLPKWSILFSVKRFLGQHPEIAEKYRGLLPLGKIVIKFINSLEEPKVDVSSQDLRSHTIVRDLSNKYARLLGIPSIMINDLMFIEALWDDQEVN